MAERKSPGEMPRGLAKIGEAAAWLGMAKPSVYALVSRGEIPAKRFGRSVRIPWAWLREQAVVDGASAEAGVLR
jgi:excisionase family DNA binding protein